MYHSPNTVDLELLERGITGRKPRRPREGLNGSPRAMRKFDIVACSVGGFGGGGDGGDSFWRVVMAVVVVGCGYSGGGGW